MYTESKMASKQDSAPMTWGFSRAVQLRTWGQLMQCLATLLIFPLSFTNLPRQATADSPPVGLQTRVEWTTSKIVGSPEAPLPYITQRVLPKLQFNQCLDLTTAPGSDRLFVVEQFGKIFSFFDDPEAGE